MANHYRRHLQDVVSASAAPYGYTLTVWTSGAVTSHAQHSIPSTADAILLLSGAALGFLVVATGAFGEFGGVLSTSRRYEIKAWGALHLPSVGIAIAAASGLAHSPLPEWLVWISVGFTATTLYLLVIAVQFALATRRYEG